MAGIIDEVTGYVTPWGTARRKQAEYQTALDNSRADKSLELQQKNLQLNAIPTLMELQAKRDKQAGWKSARNLWAAHSGRGPEAARQPSETDALIQSLISKLTSDSSISTPTKKGDNFWGNMAGSLTGGLAGRGK